MQKATEILKDCTAELHQQAEHTLFMRKLITGNAELRDYVTYLRALAILYSVLEQHVATSKNVDLCSVWREKMRKLPLLTQDINYFHNIGMVDLRAPVSCARRGAEMIRAGCISSPIQALGYLYVLEGSTNGAVLIYPRIEEAFNLKDGAGTRYMRNYFDAQQDAWQLFKIRFNQTVKNEEVLDEVVKGAKDIYQVLISILSAFEDIAQQSKIHASAFNPEAGNHNVPQQERDIEAVLIAAECVYQKIPYLKKRYGSRGKRFTQSDGAWLATLADLPEHRVYEQVDWLARFLSALGLPRVAMECHLRETVKVIQKCNSENAEKYNVLEKAADRLEKVKNQQIPLDIQKKYIQHFYKQVKSTSQAEFLAEILISAKADEAIDQSNVLSDILSWIDSDKSGLPEDIKQAAYKLSNALASL